MKSGEASLLAAAADASGRLHLVLNHRSANNVSQTHYVVLSDHAETYPLPTQAAPPDPVVLNKLDETALGIAGFVASDRSSPLPPAYALGEITTGGASAGPGWWTKPLAPPAQGRTVFEVELSASVTACGKPGLAVEFGNVRHDVAITATGLEVTTSEGTQSVALSGPPSKLRLELEAGEARFFADGRVVLRTKGTGATTTPGTARFGDVRGCGGAPQTAVRWKSVRLER